MTLPQSLGLLVGKEPELVGIDTLVLGATMAAEQLLDLMFQLLDQSLRLANRVHNPGDNLVIKG
jgi:hypothetical protein